MWQELVAAAHSQMFFIAAVYLLVVLLVGLDLWAGVRKARKRGEFRSSYGLRKTIDKLCRYLNMMLVFTCIDAIQMLALHQLVIQGGASVPRVAILTFFGAVFIGFIEIKSIWENNSEKEKARMDEALKTVAKIAKDKDMQEVFSTLLTYLQAKNETQGTANQEN